MSKAKYYLQEKIYARFTDFRRGQEGYGPWTTIDTFETHESATAALSNIWTERPSHSDDIYRIVHKRKDVGPLPQLPSNP